MLAWRTSAHLYLRIPNVNCDTGTLAGSTCMHDGSWCGACENFQIHGIATAGLLVCAMSPEARRALTADLTAKTQQQAGAGPPPPRNGRERRNQQQQAVQQVVQQAQQDDGEDSVIRQKYMQPTFTNAAAETNPAGAVEIATQTQQRAPLVQKIYRALVQGHVSEDSGEVEAAIGPIPYPGVDGGLFAASASGKAARSSWRVLERRGPGSAGPGPGPGSGSCEACTLMEVRGGPVIPYYNIRYDFLQVTRASYLDMPALSTHGARARVKKSVQTVLSTAEPCSSVGVLSQ